VKKVVDAAESLRERKKARTREAIIDAAHELFEQKGYDATTVEDIAAAAEVSPRTFFRYFDSKLDLIMVRSDTKHTLIGPLLLARPPEEGLLGAMREVMRCELDAQLDDPGVKREFQVMLTTPSLRNLAREHFYEEEAEMVPAIAARLGVAPDSLVAHVVTGMITSAIWATVNRWLAEGPELDLDRLNQMMDETFALLADGVDRAVAAARDETSTRSSTQQGRGG
jgi:AcrR family transcriptional regulator